MSTAQITQRELPPELSVKASDRLGLTIFFAVVLHSLIILGISFSREDQEKPPEKLPGLEVTIVKSMTDKEVEDAKFLAQANQEGGGNVDEELLPTSDMTSAIPSDEISELSEVVPEMVLPTETDASKMQLLTADQSKIKLKSETNESELDTNVVDEKKAQLMALKKQSEALSAEIANMRKNYAKKKRHKIIAPSTKEYRFASYQESWRKKVEHIGTQEFPDQAKRKKLEGNLTMAVTIRKDGSIAKINILKYSKYKIFDDYAKRIVNMAAPYDVFPEDLSVDFDELTIVRTWKFLPGNRVKTYAK